MKRRSTLVRGGAPAELVDPARWPRCGRWDGGDQPCFCAAGEQQQVWLDAGGEWPGGGVQYLADFLELCGRWPCNAPFDESMI